MSGPLLAPCRCHQSHAYITPAHSGHCCFVPATQTCHPAEVAEWENREREAKDPGRCAVSDMLSLILAWLREHPDSSAKTIAGAIGTSDDRLVFKLLDNAAYKGLCQRSRASNGPWLWEVPAES